MLSMMSTVGVKTVTAFFLLCFSSQILQANLIRLKDLDLENTAGFLNDQLYATTEDTLSSILHPESIERTAWRVPTTQVDRRRNNTFHYRIAFKEAKSLGSLTVSLSRPGKVSIRALKATVAYPGDPGNADHWESHTLQKSAQLLDVVFPENFQTRAILLSDTRTSGDSQLHHLWLQEDRLFRLNLSAIAQGERSEFGYDPMNLVRGSEWRNAGSDPQNGQISRPGISNIHPSSVNLVWEQPRKVSLVRIRSSAVDFQLKEFLGSEDENPALAAPNDWRPLEVVPQIRKLSRNETAEMKFVFDPPKDIRALQFQVIKVRGKSAAILEVQDFSAFQTLQPGEKPPTTLDAAPKQPPLQISYSIDVDSEPAMVINTPDGRRVRNLFAQVPRKAGDQLAGWDLKDDQGLPVPAGMYNWEVLYGPALRLIYRATVYPNTFAHSPHSTPWTGDVDDGWLSNHGNITAVCAVKDRVFIGQGGSEGGHALIEVTNTGSKIWGTHETTWNLFSDGETLFSHQGNQVRWLNRETGKQEVLFLTDDRAERSGKLVGMAAQDGNIYTAYHSPVPYLEDASTAAEVAIDQCLPKLLEEIAGGSNYGIPGRPQWDFMSLFRLTDYVNGTEANGGLIRLRSTEGVGRKQHILLSFKEPTALGSLVFPPYKAPEGVTMKAYVLKKNATFPPNVNAEEDWTEVPLGELVQWNCIPLPEGIQTQALRLTFSQPGNELDALLDGDVLEERSVDLDLGFPGEKRKTSSPGLRVGKKPEWKGELDGMRILRRRFANVTANAKISVSSGTYDPKTGVWDANRDKVLSEVDPGILTLTWDTPQKLRGLSLKEVDGEEARIDILKPSGDWEEVGVYKQKRRFLYQPSRRNNPDTVYIDGVVDFGRDVETSAVRIRVISQWKEQTGRPWGIREDRGGRTVDLKRCRIYGVAALSYLGGEVEKSSIGVQRLEVRNSKTGQIVKEIPSTITGELSFGPDGKLYGIAGTTIIRAEDGKVTVEGLENPVCLEVSKEGEYFVYDHGETNRQVKVFSQDGKLLRKIGNPGRRVAGPFDPELLEDINEMTLDSEGNLWMVYKHDNPRRVIKFSAEGKFLAEFYGNTNYGGGGILDPWDPTRMYYRDMIFKLDHETGKSQVVALMSADHMDSSDYSKRRIRWLTEPLMVNGQRYIVTAPHGVQTSQNVGVVHLFDEESMTVQMCAAMGLASSFPPLQDDPEMLGKVGGNPLGGYRFLWNDLNQNGQPDLDEVEFTKLDTTRFTVGKFDHELGIQSGNLRWEVARFLKDGTPIYEEKSFPFEANFRLTTGNYFRYGQEANEVLNAEGELIWSYPASTGMQGLFVPPFQHGVVDLQYGIKGYGITSPDGLGDFFVVFGNHGQTNVWTADGFLATRLTHHIRDPRRRTFSSFSHKLGTDVTGVTLGQEHFFNYFCQTTKDGRFYMVGEHLSASLFEVIGLDKFKRVRGTIEVTPELIEKTRDWEAQRIEKDHFAKPKIAKSIPGKPVLDGFIERSEYPSKTLEMEDVAEFHYTHDEKNLYVAWRSSSGVGPLKNTGTEFQRVFKTGGAVDLKLGLNASADAKRRRPVSGDIRVVFTNLNGKPSAILYRPVSTNRSKSWATTTVAGGTTRFDEVSLLKNVRIKHQEFDRHYILEAVLPWSSLGLKTAPAGQRLRFDWSVLTTENGHQTTGRQSWANALAVGITDEPTEAKLMPGLWGWLEIQAKDSNVPDLDAVLGGKKKKETLDDLLDGL